MKNNESWLTGKTALLVLGLAVVVFLIIYQKKQKNN